MSSDAWMSNVGSLYLAWRSRDFSSLAPSSFRRASLFYLYLADASLPLLGTGLVAANQRRPIHRPLHLVLALPLFRTDWRRRYRQDEPGSCTFYTILTP